MHGLLGVALTLRYLPHQACAATASLAALLRAWAPQRVGALAELLAALQGAWLICRVLRRARR
jgi:hypothetical protein